MFVFTLDPWNLHVELIMTTQKAPQTRGQSCQHSFSVLRVVCNVISFSGTYFKAFSTPSPEAWSRGCMTPWRCWSICWSFSSAKTRSRSSDTCTAPYFVEIPKEFEFSHLDKHLEAQKHNTIPMFPMFFFKELKTSLATQQINTKISEPWL